MQVLSQRCAGIDGHLRFLVVCLSIVEAGQRRKEIRSLRNETADLLNLPAGQATSKQEQLGQATCASIIVLCDHSYSA